MLTENPLLLKLRHGAALTDADCELLDRVCSRSHKVGAREDIIQEGEQPDDVHLVLDGFVCRYKSLASGKRSIMAYLVPGDFCDLHVAILGTMDHSIATLAACTMARISRSTIEELTTHPRIARALWWANLVDEATLREWLVNIGQRPADRQLAHLFCELLARLKTVGRTYGDAFKLPMTQDELGDSLGISAVHVNRVLQQLREDGLVTLQDRMLGIPDVRRLERFAEFDPGYLHLNTVLPQHGGDSVGR